ncbi:hypothetical protein P3T36_002332 [Kitasatospora sp. MAP12-15]|uniref:hypothetical protein n=1 Tax=unclassified Kitasatospora TaxID=2633591 RepID=UPI002473C940|nr:hypothetical protein [Kitasatospora sp. MAP12-44]MDH6108747.1 hypothetical protein [Kitasatospora sp. MAP12-44]
MLRRSFKLLGRGGSTTRRTLSRVCVGAGALVLTVAAGAAAPAAGAATPQHDTHPLKPRPHNAAPAVIGGALINHGGPVQSAPRVYVDYWGWGSDPSGEQNYLNRFLSSVGGTPWLATVDQYGADSAPGLLAATWSDPAAVPASPSDAQIQAEAAAAANHFGTGTSVNVQIVVATPTGHSTPGFGSQWCAYHGAVASLPNVTYTDLPYMTDAGSGCGADMVNGSGGLLDGVSIVEGHELAEAITDPMLNAWYDAGGNEIGDKCAWSGLSNIGTSAGTFAVQPLWSNGANGCVLSTGYPQLLTAGSFEQNTTGWQRLGPPGAIVNMVNYNTATGAPAPAHDGTGYLAFNTNTAGGSVYQDIPVSATVGASYTASVWLSSQSGGASGTFCLWGLGASNTNVCTAYNVSSSTGYQYFQVVYNVPQAISTLRFQVYPTANGGTTDMDTASTVRTG